METVTCSIEKNSVSFVPKFTITHVNLARKLKNEGFPQSKDPYSYYYGADKKIHLINSRTKKEDLAQLEVYLPLESDINEFLDNAKLFNRCIFFSEKANTVIRNFIIKKPNTGNKKKLGDAFYIAKDFEKNPDNYWHVIGSTELSCLYLGVSCFLRWVAELKE